MFLPVFFRAGPINEVSIVFAGELLSLAEHSSTRRSAKQKNRQHQSPYYFAFFIHPTLSSQMKTIREAVVSYEPTENICSHRDELPCVHLSNDHSAHAEVFDQPHFSH